MQKLTTILLLPSTTFPAEEFLRIAAESPVNLAKRLLESHPNLETDVQKHLDENNEDYPREDGTSESPFADCWAKTCGLFEMPTDHVETVTALVIALIMRHVSGVVTVDSDLVAVGGASSVSVEIAAETQNRSVVLNWSFQISSYMQDMRWSTFMSFESLSSFSTEALEDTIIDDKCDDIDFETLTDSVLDALAETLATSPETLLPGLSVAPAKTVIRTDDNGLPRRIVMSAQEADGFIRSLRQAGIPVNED